MNPGRYVVLIILAGSVLTGCASARLNLDLALYAEDPSGTLVQLTPVRMAELDRALKGLARDVGPLAEDRRMLAVELFNTYQAVNAALIRIMTGAAASRVDPNVEAARGYLETYKRDVTALAAEANKRIKEAQAALDLYARPQTGTAPTDGSPTAVNELSVLRAVNEAANSVASLGGPLDTEFERLLIAYWPVVAASITPVNVRKLASGNVETPELIELRQQVKRLAEKVRVLRERGRKVPEVALIALDQAFKEGQLSPGELKASFDRLILAAAEVSTAQPPPDQLEALVKASGRTFNLVDRLQDPADPVWRVVSQPENEAKWRTTFAETYFYAEGNTATVVVRDTPFSFRFLKATNNPTALVQSQLQVSRAIANAAIAVAGAATGAPIPKLPGAEAGAAPSPSTAGTSEVELLAKRKATVERQQAIRQESIRGLRRNLAALRGQVERADGADQAAIDAILLQIRTLLTAYDVVLAPSP